MKYSKEEILEFVQELKSEKRSLNYGQFELVPPSNTDLKAAQIIEQLLSRKCSGKCKS
jgi:hypothetical protein